MKTPDEIKAEVMEEMTKRINLINGVTLQVDVDTQHLRCYVLVVLTDGWAGASADFRADLIYDYPDRERFLDEFAVRLVQSYAQARMINLGG